MREKTDPRRIIRQMMLQRLTENGRHQNSTEQQEPIVFPVTHDFPPYPFVVERFAGYSPMTKDRSKDSPLLANTEAKDGVRDAFGPRHRAKP
jgi:hypothetical protein